MKVQSLFLMLLFLAALLPILTLGAGDFIRTSCSTTRYPDVCYASLAPLAAKIGTDPGKLALQSIVVSLSKSSSLYNYVAGVKANKPDVTNALKACKESLNDALEYTKEALGGMQKLVPPPPGLAKSFKAAVDTVQTQMSTAMTDEEDCKDGFENVAEEPVKADVLNRVSEAQKYESVALSFIVNYGQKGKQ